MSGWGDWTGFVSCNQYPDTAFYIVNFALAVELPVCIISFYMMANLYYMLIRLPYKYQVDI